VWDNASTDGTWEWLQQSRQENLTQLYIVGNDLNEGFIVPNNHAYIFAKAAQADYLVLLNNDTVVPAGWLDALLRPLLDDNAAAASGPRGGCSMLLDTCQGTMGPKLEYLEGSCLMLKMSALSKLGGPLFSRYIEFAYGEDADLSLRLQEQGFTLHHVDLDIQHRGSATKHSDQALVARCEAAEAKNHEAMRKRWAHWLKWRTFNYPIVVRRRAAHGDVLLTTPILKAIRASYPRHILMLQTDCCDLHPGFNHLYDCMFSMDGAIPENSLVIDLDGAYENMPGTHYVHAYEAVARRLLPLLGEVGRELQWDVKAQDAAWAGAQRRALGLRKLCVMHAGTTGWPGRDWPFDRFVTLAQKLSAAGWQCVFVGLQPIPPLPTNLHAFDLTRQTTTGQLAALLAGAELFIGIDSFPMHLAQAVGCRTVGIFGMTNSRYVLTAGSSIGADANASVACAGIRHREAGKEFIQCPTECIESVTVEDVITAASWLVTVTHVKPVTEQPSTPPLDKAEYFG